MSKAEAIKLLIDGVVALGQALAAIWGGADARAELDKLEAGGLKITSRDSDSANADALSDYPDEDTPAP